MLVTLIFILLILFILASMIYFFLKKLRLSQRRLENTKTASCSQPSVSVEAFSGDNTYDTELDLAQAYLELQQYEQAKQLLKSVITHGAPEQILAARQMFSVLLKKERAS